MYIETSRPRLEGEKARLVSPVFSVAPKNPYGATNTAYCFSFYYHMYGQHIGERKPMSWSFPLRKIVGKTSSCMKEKHGRSASPSKTLL
ncbi:MDGA2 protein, partial [Daphoenositta chrysoptera]|nr:MDGA2 protein [Daphoenositta chrysoptera]